MSEQAMWLVGAFRWGALVLGVPSLAGTVGFGLLSLLMWWQRPDPKAANGTDAKVSESLVNVVVVMAGWAAKALGALTGLVEVFVQLAALASLGGLLFAGLLFWTSRGLAGHALWARGVAGLLMIVFLLVGCLVGLSSGFGPFRLVGVGMVLLAGYSLWVIWRLTL
jgi:hypothetical protein